MQLRNHPKINRWPPQWGGAFDPKTDTFLIGDSQGTLKGARVVHKSVEVTAEWNGKSWLAHIESDDEELLNRVCDVLKKNLGRPLREIGGLEIGK